MKVKDLHSILREFNPEHDILCYCEDENNLPDKHIIRIFEIRSVERKEAEKTRAEDGIPSLKFGKTQNSTPHVLIEITADI